MSGRDGAEAAIARAVEEAVRGLGGTLAADWIKPALGDLPRNGRGGGASTAGKILSNLLVSGLGMRPLASFIGGLFGGGEPEPPPLAKYAPPAPVRFELANAKEFREMRQVDYAQDGRPRPVPPQITVQVQAMDSRSFLDHSDEIARAVREAMLNSHSINDLIGEL